MKVESEVQSVLEISVPEADSILDLVRLESNVEVPPIGANTHITIMYPWMSPALIDELTIKEFTSLFSDFCCFNFSLQLGWFGREALLLVPEDDSPFVQMTEAVLARWPQYPYYNGEYDKIVPHISLAYGDEDSLSIVGELISSHVPINGQATFISLSTGRPGFMKCCSKVPLIPIAHTDTGGRKQNQRFHNDHSRTNPLTMTGR